MQKPIISVSKQNVVLFFSDNGIVIRKRQKMLLKLLFRGT